MCSSSSSGTRPDPCKVTSYEVVCGLFTQSRWRDWSSSPGDCSRPRCLETGDTDDVAGMVMGTAAWQQISGVLGLNCGRCPVHTVHPTPDRDSVFGKETLMMSHENKSCASYSYTTEQTNRKCEWECWCWCWLWLRALPPRLHDTWVGGSPCCVPLSRTMCSIIGNFIASIAPPSAPPRYRGDLTYIGQQPHYLSHQQPGSCKSFSYGDY